MATKEASAPGGGEAGMLTTVFVVLKLTGVIGWSWWWVLAPSWMWLLAVVLLIAWAAMTA